MRFYMSKKSPVWLADHHAWPNERESHLLLSWMSTWMPKTKTIHHLIRGILLIKQSHNLIGWSHFRRTLDCNINNKTFTSLGFSKKKNMAQPKITPSKNWLKKINTEETSFWHNYGHILSKTEQTNIFLKKWAPSFLSYYHL